MQKYLTRPTAAEDESPDMITKTQVLLVEDDSQVRVFMEEALRFLGYEVMAADGAEAALARLECAEFDVIITDHRMPGRTGLELVHVLRQLGFAGRVYVVSGVLSSGERQAYEALRVDGIAAKPLALSELNGLLRERIRPWSRTNAGAGNGNANEMAAESGSSPRGPATNGRA